MPLLAPVAYHLGLLESAIRTAGERAFPRDHADAHVLNALLFVKKTRALDELGSSARDAARGLAELAEVKAQGKRLEEARKAAMRALDALREALAEAAPSDHAKARGVVPPWWGDEAKKTSVRGRSRAGSVA